MKATPVPMHQIDAMWPMVSDWVRAACDRGDGSWTVLDAQREVYRGNGGLWLVLDDNNALHGFGITTTERWPDGSTVGVVMMAGGERGVEWVGLIEQLEAWAKTWGASRMIVRGRKGWMRWLKQYRLVEWSPRCLTLEKNLER